MKIKNRFLSVAEMLPPFERLLICVPEKISSEATEIRVRAGRPLAVETPSGRYICGTRTAETDEIYACIKSFCNYSVHSCQRELSEGWITLKGGHRAGFTGTAFIKDGRIETIKDISSINVRISREHKGISDFLFSYIAAMGNLRGLIIAGPPLSGKTTFLRDYCRNLGSVYKTALADERGEIAASYLGVPQNDIGMNTDVLNCFPKGEAIGQAVRTLSPQFIVCDEIGADIEDVIKCSGCGVTPILSVHCGGIAEAEYNASINRLINSGTVNYIAFLGGGKAVGTLKGLWCIENGKDISCCNDGNNLLCGGNGGFGGFKNARGSA